jgi:predicted AAA+ superfamily ATPase
MFYMIDNGMRNAVSFRFSEDTGQLFENLVFIELRRRETAVYYYRGKQECDFITEDKGLLNTAIQVCFELNDGNREREIGGITDAMNELGIKQGLILTYNQEETIANDGKEIAVVPVWRWLIEDTAPV